MSNDEFPSEADFDREFAVAGRLMTNWNILEEELSRIYATVAVGASSPRASEALMTGIQEIRSFEQRLMLVDRVLATLSVFQNAGYEEWLDLRTRLRELSAVRNAVAHGRIIYAIDDDGAQFALHSHEERRANSLRKHSTKLPASAAKRLTGPSIMSMKELRAAVDDIHTLERDVREYRDRLSSMLVSEGTER